MELTHLDKQGRARMVDVTAKPETVRRAVAYGEVSAEPATIRRIADHDIAKGNVLTIAQIAGINAAKRTGELIPLCHPLPLTHIDVELNLDEEKSRILIKATATASGKTGVEMEAMTAVAVAGLTIYDMCKAVDRTMTIGSIMLIEKHGGKSGDFIRPGWASSG